PAGTAGLVGKDQPGVARAGRSAAGRSHGDAGAGTAGSRAAVARAAHLRPGRAHPPHRQRADRRGLRGDRQAADRRHRVGRPVMAHEAAFTETSAQPRVERVPLGHLSIELGHLYMEDYEAGIDSLRWHFRQVAPWANAARQACAAALGDRTPRISTCFLVDDYFAPFGSPREIVPQLVEAAAEAGLHIDYLGRESGCAEADDVDLGRLG